MAGYGDDAGFTAYMTANGYTVPAGTIAAARQRGSAYIDAVYGERFTGYPTGGIEQDRAWPRTDAEDVHGNAIAASAIPTRVINASYEAALIELRVPGSLSVTIDPGKRIKRQKVEGIEREFFAPTVSNAYAPNAPVISLIDGMLAPLIGLSVPLPAILIV